MFKNSGCFMDCCSSDGYSSLQIHLKIDGRVVNRSSERSMFLQVLMHTNELLMIHLRLVGYLFPYNRAAARPFPVSFNLSYMWISTLAFVACLIVGYFGSWIISCCRGKPNEVPEIYLSPIRIQFPKKCTTAKGQKGKTKARNVGISKQACEISTISFTDKSQTETHL
ncbi:uncharacterized protein TNCV_2893001 [Trichonephila clavipes]|nr:uncharacterized protein TNCV_2893001 [Trichonephila clavipes]